MGYQEDGTIVGAGFHVYPEQAPQACGRPLPTWLVSFSLLGAPGEVNQVVSYKVSTATEMLTRVPKGGGLDFGISGSGKTESYRHSGGNAGYSCFVVAFTKTGRGVVVLTNSDTGTPLIEELLSAISRQYDWP